METLETKRSFLRTISNDDETEKLARRRLSGKSEPALHKSYSEDAVLFDLFPAGALTVGQMPLHEVLNRRRSRRQYTGDPLTLEELSFLLWATQGVQKVLGNGITQRTAPSGCARHPLETYLSVHRVDGLEPGLYRYLPLKHKLCLLFLDADMAQMSLRCV